MGNPERIMRNLLLLLLMVLGMMGLLWISLFVMGHGFAYMTHIQYSTDVLIKAWYLSSQLNWIDRLFLFASWFFVGLLSLLPFIFIILIKLTQPKKSLHGDTRFATQAELKKNKLLWDIPPKDGILMGKLSSFTKEKYISMTGQTSVFLFATPGTGKTMSVVISNAVNFLGSTIIFDQKYEIFKMTAGFRKQFSEVHLLNFSGTLPPDLANNYKNEEVSSCWNPFTYVNSDPLYRQTDLRKMAHVLFEKDLKNSRDTYFVQSAINLFVGIAMLMYEIGETLTLGNVISKMIVDSDQYETFNEYIKNLLTIYKEVLSEETVEVLSIFMDGNTKSSQDVLSTMRKTFAFYTGTRIAALTSKDSFDLRELRKKKLSIYVGVQQDDISIYTPLMKLFFSQVVSTQIKLGTKEQNKEIKNQCLMILDEFGELVDIEIIQKMMTLMRGYDMRLLAVFHNLGQLRESYGEDGAKTFLSCFQGQIIYAQSIQKDADEMSAYIGYYTEKAMSKGRSRGKNSVTNSVNVSDQKRALVLPDELKHMPMEDCILTFQGVLPIQAKKTLYSTIRYLDGRVNLPIPGLPKLDLAYREEIRPIKEINLKRLDMGEILADILRRADIKLSGSIVHSLHTGTHKRVIMSTNSQEIEKALNYIDSTERDTWIKIGSAIKTELGEEGFHVWDQWSQRASNYCAKAAKTNWKSLKPGRVNIGTLFHYAKQGGYKPSNNPSFANGGMANLAKREAERYKSEELQLKKEAQAKSQRIWNNGKPVSQHPYVNRKLITNLNVLEQLKQTTIQGANLLLVPIKDIHGEIRSLQYINEDGTKGFTGNGETKGHFLLLGSEKHAKEEVILAEGLATGASIYEATNKPVLVTFNAANMIAVAKELAQNNYSRNYTLAIDNDSSATGLNKALEAQRYLPNAKIIAPSFTQSDVVSFQERFGQLPSDFNDKHLIAGIDAIKHQFHIPVVLPPSQEIDMSQTQTTTEPDTFNDELKEYEAMMANTTSTSSQDQLREYEMLMEMENTTNPEELVNQSSQVNSTQPPIEDLLEPEPDELQNGIKAEDIGSEKNYSQANLEEITLDKIPKRQKLQGQNKSWSFGENVKNTNPDNKSIQENSNEKIKIADEPKQILDLNYEIPPAIKKLHTVHKGNFIDANNNLHFKDFGEELRTQRTDEQTIRNMLEVAQAKNWNSIKLTGSREFKLQAWLLASERDMEILGFKPNEQELANLDKLAKNYTNTIESTHINQSVRTQETISNQAPTRELFTIIKFGKDHKNFDSDNARTSYLQYQDQEGTNFYIWDKKIQEYVHSEKLRVGDRIYEPKVIKTIDKNFMNEKKEIISYKEKIWKFEKYVEQKIENNPPLKQENPKTLTNHKVIEMGNGIDQNGEKNFFIKVEKNGEQQTLWGKNLKEQVKGYGIYEGDRLAKVSLINGRLEIQPMVLPKGHDKSSIISQVEGQAEKDRVNIKENKTSLDEKKFLDMQDKYLELKKGLPKHDQIIAQHLENQLKETLKDHSEEEQQRRMYALYQKFTEDYIKDSRLEIPSQFIASQPTQTQEFSQAIETRQELTFTRS